MTLRSGERIKVMNRNLYIRQAGLVELDALSLSIEIIGAGGIGSWTALALAKMGCQNVSIWDADIIEVHNAGSQVYNEKDAGKLKVDSLSEKVEDLSGISLSLNAYEWIGQDLPMAKVIISAVDSMEVRRKLYEAHKGNDQWFIDGRMAANEINLYAFKLNNLDMCSQYEKTLFSDDQARAVACSERAVIYNVITCGGLIASLIARIANNQEVPFERIVDLYNLTMN
jgi:molybdopterin/thiamine biosynthesis adenylyltransferase